MARCLTPQLVNSLCRKQRKISTRLPKTPLRKVPKSSRDNCCLMCGIDFKLAGQGSFFNTTTTAGLKENLTVVGKSPDFSLSSRWVCKCCKQKADSVIKRTLILEQDKAFLIDSYRNNSTSSRQCARETAELSPSDVSAFSGETTTTSGFDGRIFTFPVRATSTAFW